jgi:hypothetical protein
MFDLWATFANKMDERTARPLSLRLLIQPMVAGILAIEDGMRDTRERRPPYGWSIPTDAEHRTYLLETGWKTVGKVVLLVFALDLGYLLLVHRAILPRQSIMLAVVLALIPHLVLRGGTARIATPLCHSA